MRRGAVANAASGRANHMGAISRGPNNPGYSGVLYSTTAKILVGSGPEPKSRCVLVEGRLFCGIATFEYIVLYYVKQQIYPLVCNKIDALL